MWKFQTLSFCFVVGCAFAQDQRPLAIRPLAAEWSAPLQRIIAITSGPNRLVILDPVTNSFTSVGLSKAPLSLAVSLDGFYGAVGQDGLVSYVNLATATLVRATNVTGAVNSLAVNNDWIYGQVFGSMRASTGVIDGNGNNFYSVGERPRIDPSGKWLYGYYGYRWDISAGPLNNQSYTSSNSLLNYGRYSFSGDGLRAYLLSGQVGYRTDSNSDFVYQLKLESSAGGVLTVADSPTRVVSIPIQQTYYLPNTKDNELFLYDKQYLGQAARLVIPDFAVNSRSYQAHGKWVFFDSTGANLYVVSQADTTSGLLNDFGLYSISFSSPAACVATFATSSATSHFYGSTITVGVKAAQNCIYQAATAESWIRLGTGAFGSGDGSLTIAIRPNRTAASRSGVVSLGSQQFAITQSAFGPAETLVKLPSKVADTAYSNTFGGLTVAVSDPPELLLQTSTEDVFVPLVKKPVSVGVSPDGRTAVIGFDGWASIFDLATRAVTKTFPMSGEATRIAVASNGFAYGVGNGQVFSLNLNAGTSIQVGGYSNYYYNLALPNPALHPSGYGMYVGGTKFDITGGSARQLYGVSSICSATIVTEDGLRLVDICGQVFRSAETQSQDLQPNGTLGVNANIGLSSLMHVGSRRSLVVTASPTTNLASQVNGIELQTFSDENLAITGRITLPKFTVGVNQYKGIGRYLFWANAGAGQTPDRILSVVQAEPASGLVSDFGYTVYVPGQASSCVSLPSSSTTVGGSSGTGSFVVNTNASCLWEAKSNETWLTVVAGGLTVGNGTVSFSVEPNTLGGARSGTISVGGVLYTVNQAASSGTITLSPLSSNVMSFGGDINISVNSTSSSLGWTATSNAPWITIGTGAIGTGSGSVRLTVASSALVTARTGTVTIGGQLISITQAASRGLQFVPVTPCRVSDTRNANGSFGGPFLSALATRDIPIPQSACNIPTNAVAYSMNVTVVPRGPLGYITLWPTGISRPVVSTLNATDGRIKANAAILQAGTGGAVSVFATDATDVILDINGYFAPPQGDGLVFYPLAPCRLYDSRTSSNPLAARETRVFSMAGTCSVPGTAKVLSLNTTVVPRGVFGYLTIWPDLLNQPVVSTLNAVTGVVTANAAIVPVGQNGNIKVYVTDPTDLVLDINGYFAPPGGGNSQQFYPLAPCRISDTRNPTGALGGPALVAAATRIVPVRQAPCAVPPEATGYLLNATVVPSGVFGFLSLWPVGTAQPTVSTLNAVDGFVTSNMAIVPAGTNGGINIFGSNAGHVLFDLTGYFAP